MHKTKRHLRINCKILQAMIFSEMQIKPVQKVPFHIWQILARYSKLRHAWFVSIFVLFKETYNDLFHRVSNNKVRKSFHSRTVHLDIINFFIIHLNAQLDCSRLKLTLKFTLKCNFTFIF